MDKYTAIKDIVIPILAPLGAASAVVFGFFRQARRTRRDATNALYRELDWTWQQYKLLAGALATGGTPEPERIAEIQEAWGRIFKRILEDSAAMAGFYQRYLTKIDGEPLLLLGEAKVKFEQTRTDSRKVLDLELQFALHNLLWLCASDKAKVAKHRDNIRQFLEKRPDLRKVLIKRPGSEV